MWETSCIYFHLYFGFAIMGMVLWFSEYILVNVEGWSVAERTLSCVMTWAPWRPTIYNIQFLRALTLSYSAFSFLEDYYTQVRFNVKTMVKNLNFQLHISWPVFLTMLTSYVAHVTQSWPKVWLDCGSDLIQSWPWSWDSTPSISVKQSQPLDWIHSQIYKKDFGCHKSLHDHHL